MSERHAGNRRELLENRLYQGLFTLFFKLQLIYNIVLVAGVQQSDSVIYILYIQLYIYIFLSRFSSLIGYYRGPLKPLVSPLQILSLFCLAMTAAVFPGSAHSDAVKIRVALGRMQRSLGVLPVICSLLEGNHFQSVKNATDLLESCSSKVGPVPPLQRFLPHF